MDFVHLHVHSHYSILDGAASIEGLVAKAAEYKMKALALTDHGYMFGIKAFFDECKKKSIKPLLGVEAYLAEKGHKSKAGKEEYSGYHVILIAKNKIGYHNLVKLCTIASTEGFYQRPRIDRELLEKYGEGLIVSSACLGGEIPQKILLNDFDAAEKAIEWYKNLFGSDFYLELMLHFSDDPEKNKSVYAEQLIVNKYLVDAAKRHRIKLIATNDIHFINKADADAHDLLICLTTGKSIDDPNRMRYTKQEYFKSPDEMYELFGDNLEALTNTCEIADKVEYFDLNSKPIMPYFKIPESFATLTEYEKKFREHDLILDFGQEKYNKLDGSFTDKLRIKLESDYLEQLTMAGAVQKYGDPLPDEVLERIRFEIDTIKTMGFPGYFLIVQDFVKYAKDHGVIVGPGRGSAAGSIIAYCNGIIDIDPLKHDLLFERFLNPDRISMPDVDIDFDDDGRQSVLNYVTEKYGKENVAQIVTFGTMAAKMVIKDVARVLGLPLSDAERLTKLLPDLGAKLANAYEIILSGESRLGSIEKVIEETNKEITSAKKEGNDSILLVLETRKIIASEIIDARAKKDSKRLQTLQFACTLEGSVRQTAVHACGVIIGRDELQNHIPLMPSKESSVLCTQYDGHFVESIGLLKMDFLGLKTLSILREAIQNVKEYKAISIDIHNIPFDDEKVYELFSKGETTGIFQFESDPMKAHLRNLRPNRFDDLVAMNALYRPGPMEYIPSFINRKLGREKIDYDHPMMEKYLEKTYGVTVYQEQVMLLSRALAGFTRGESDQLRKAMGKKNEKLMQELKAKFFEGCHKNPQFTEGCKRANKPAQDLIEKIWKDWEAFAKYAFNKSHSVCYAHLAYQTAYMKAHFPAEFMAASMSRNLSDIKEITKLMEECRRMKMKVLGPDINDSSYKFKVTFEGNLRFGLVAVKNVGTNAVTDIIKEREKNGPFTDIFNFAERVNLNAVNKKNIEALAYSGAFDCFDSIERHQYFLSSENGQTSFIENLISYGNAMQARKNGSMDLFGDIITVDTKKPGIPPATNVYSTEWLNHERDHIGVYISAHPLDAYSFEIKNLNTTPLADLKDLSIHQLDETHHVIGLITKAEEKIGKTGNPYGKLIIEDYSDNFSINFYSKDYLDYKMFFQEGQSVMITGTVKKGFKNPDERIFQTKNIRWLAELKENYFHSLELTLNIADITEDFVGTLTKIVKKNKGKIKLYLIFEESEKTLSIKTHSRTYNIELSDDMIHFVENCSTIRRCKLN